MKTYTAAKQLVDNKTKTRQFSTFVIDGRSFGIDVMKVQEVTKPLHVTLMRTAPPFVKGLINLRGQITTAIGLRELFGLGEEKNIEKMTVVCRIEDVLISLLVDTIGDVMEIEESKFEPTPASVPKEIQNFMLGVYKTEEGILSVINLDYVMKELEKRCA